MRRLESFRAYLCKASDVDLDLAPQAALHFTYCNFTHEGHLSVEIIIDQVAVVCVLYCSTFRQRSFSFYQVS